MYGSPFPDRTRYLGLTLLGALFVAVVWQASILAERTGIGALREDARHKLSLYGAALRAELGRYAFLPELLATNESLIAYLAAPGTGEAFRAINTYLETINAIAGAADTYLLDPAGVTVAASNWDSERPFIGKDFSFRPYFQEAMSGRLGRYFALGTTSNKRGYYFAYPVRRGDQILGVVVVKVSLAATEAAWASDPFEYLVTDPDGVVFISTRQWWKFRALRSLSEEAARRIVTSRRYGEVVIEELAVTSRRTLPTGATGVTIELGRPASVTADSTAGTRQETSRVEYLIENEAMAEAGWRLHVLAPLRPVYEQALALTASAGAVCFGIFLAGLALWQRRRERLCREQALRRDHEELESQVRLRTSDLSRTNARLSREIDERRKAEEDLRRTQDELIQAAKLAGLGQMSAGINHELNQPLAAIRTYADNARALLALERVSEAQANLQQIGELTTRMAEIVQRLKGFARKSSGQTVTLSVQAALDDALEIAGVASDRRAVELVRTTEGDEPWVLGDLVRLQQVFLNLIGNALHAMAQTLHPTLWIHIHTDRTVVRISVRDAGPGIAPDALPQVFDPFFTTKEPGQGLGLGLALSMRIVTDLGGALRAANHPEGGAVFTVELVRAQPHQRELRWRSAAR